MSESPLIQAVQRNDITTVQRLLRSDVRVNTQGGPDNATPLYYAAKLGFLDLVEVLGDYKGCHVDLGSDHRVSPYLVACAHGHTFVAQHLQGKACNIEHVDDAGRSAVHHAAMSGHSHTLRYLIQDSGLEKNLRDSTGHTPLHLAAIHNQHRDIAYLLKCRCEVNTFNSTGATPLWSVCSKGLVEVAKVFIHEILLHGNKYWLDEIDREGRTAVYEAVKQGHIEILQYLVKAGADVNICRAREGKEPFTGESPLLKAMQKASLVAVDTVLAAKGCDVDLPFRGQKVTPVHWAVILDNELSTSWREDPVMNDQLGSCPITYIQILQRLLEHKPNLNTLDEQYHTPLHTACSQGNQSIAKMLCQRGADINMKCKRFLNMEGGGKLYLTPVEMALWKGHTPTFQEMVTSGAVFVIGDWMKVPELRKRLTENPNLLDWVKSNRK